MKLSVCLIVKNEERVLGRCLACAARIADELIVVDTGSSDGSVAIARQYTPHVYLHPWQNSFAEARNYAYSKATCDYMMWLDADDVIAEDDLRRFQRLKETCPADTDVVFTLYRNYSEDGITTYILRDRIIRRALSPKCEGDAHEAIPMRPEWKCRYETGITIIHKKEYVNEPHRNMDIFDRNIREKKAMTSYEKINYCKELVLAGRGGEAYRVFRELRETVSPSGYYYALYFLTRALLRQGEYEACLRETEELERRMPTTALMVYIQGLCHEAQGRREAAKQCYLRAMTVGEDPTTLYIQDTGYTDYFPLLRLAEIAAREGDRHTAMDCIGRAAALYPRHEAWRQTRITVLLLA